MLLKVFARALVRAGMIVVAVTALVLWAGVSHSAQYASMIMDARNGKVLYSRHADMQLHPASLTKMMTLYIAFEAVENGEITLDTRVKISRFAASEPASKIHLRPGSRIALRYLIRAAAVRSANDAATAIAEAISGSERAFADRMNRTARSMGMNLTHFRNAHGLTEKGHVSTARDMTILARHVIYDYPEYYNLFSRRSTDAGVKTVWNTNRQFLRDYSGADGIKTGYTSAAGFNLVASAKRGNKRIIATVFGGRSVKTRNSHVAELLDKGFRMAEANVAFISPKMPEYRIGTVVRVRTNVARASRPMRPPWTDEFLQGDVADLIVQEMGSMQLQTAIEGAGDAVEVDGFPAMQISRPMRRPKRLDRVSASLASDMGVGIFVGKFATRQAAEQHLLKSALMDFSSLSGARKSIQLKHGSYVAKFVGLSEANARKACARLAVRKMDCTVVYTQ